MYSINDLEDTLNWSYDQVRDRIVKLRDRMEGVTERGKNNKIFITEKGLSLLQKVKDLESQGKSVQSSIKTIAKDLEDNDRKDNIEIPKYDITSSNQEEVELLKEQIRELKEDKRYLRNQLDKKDNQIQQLIPGSRENESDEFGEMSLFQVIKEWFQQPV